MWEMNKKLDTFKFVSEIMRSESQVEQSRADIIDYLIKRVQKREEQLKEIKNMCSHEIDQNIKNEWILENIISESEL
jgi:DNA-binding protein H-NS